MSLWVLILACLVCTWCALRIFATERQVRIALMEIEHIRVQAERRRAEAKLGRRRSS